MNSIWFAATEKQLQEKWNEEDGLNMLTIRANPNDTVELISADETMQIELKFERPARFQVKAKGMEINRYNSAGKLVHTAVAT